MTPPVLSALRLAAVLTAAAPCAAQPQPDPLNAATPVPAFTFRSSLAGFRPLGDDKTVPWKEMRRYLERRLSGSREKP